MRNLSDYKLVLQGAGVLIFGPQGFLLVLLALSYAAVIPALVFVPIIVVSIAVICGLGLMFLAWFGGASNWKAYLAIGMSLASLGSLYTLSISNPCSSSQDRLH